MFKSSLNVDVHDTNKTRFECLDGTVYIEHENSLRLLTVYRPYSCFMPGFLEEFTDVIFEVVVLNPEIFVFGEFNIPFDNKVIHDTRDFFNILSVFDLESQIATPTHVGGHTFDNVLSKTDNSYRTHFGVRDIGISDHYPID